MADAYQVRASIGTWLKAVLPINPSLTGDRIAFQALEEQVANEWRVHWDGEIEGHFDQSLIRLVQIDRQRSDGDEIGLERELVATLTAMGLAGPGRAASVPLFDFPDAPMTVIGHARVCRQMDAGWRLLPDPEGRFQVLRSALTLEVQYPG